MGGEVKNKIEITKGKLAAWLSANILVILGGLWWLSSLNTKVELMSKQLDNVYQFMMKGF